MQLPEDNNENLSIFECEFELYIKNAYVQIKFPCSYFLQWKTNNGKLIVSSKKQYQALQSNKCLVPIEQSMKLKASIIFDKSSGQYIRKESLLLLNLISKSRPDQIKLVGRVALDLSSVLNCTQRSQNQQSVQSESNHNHDPNITSATEKHQLEYCSVDSSIDLNLRAVSVRPSKLHLGDLDRSSFNEYMSFQASFHKVSSPEKNQQKNSIQSPRLQKIGNLNGFSLENDSDTKSVRSLGRKGTKPVANKGTIQHESSYSRNGSFKGIAVENNINSLTSLNKEQVNVERIVNGQGSQNMHLKVDLPITNRIEHSLKGQRALTWRDHRKNDQNFDLNDDSRDQAVLRRELNNFSFNQQQKSEVGSKANDNRDSQVINIDRKDQRSDIGHKQGIPFRQQMMQKDKELLESLKKQKQFQSQVHKATLSIRQLENQLEVKEKNILSLTRENKQLHLKINSVDSSGLRSSIVNDVQRVNQESKSLVKLTETIAEWETKYTDLNISSEKDRANWKKERQDLTMQMRTLSVDLIEANRKYQEQSSLSQDLSKKLDSMQKESVDRLTENQLLKNDLTMLQRETEQSHEQLQRLRESNKCLANSLDLANESILAERSKLKEFTSSCTSDFQQKFKVIEEESQTQAKKSQQMKQRVESLEWELIEREGEREGLKEELKVYKSEIQRKDSELLQLGELLQSQKKGHEALKQDRNVIQVEKIKLQERCRELQKRQGEFQCEKAKLIGQQTQKLNQIKQKDANCREQQKSLQAQITTLENTLLTLNQQLQEQSQSLQECKVHEEKLKEQVADIGRKFQSAEQSFEQSILRKDDTILALDMRVAELQKEVQEQKIENEQFKHEIRKWEEFNENEQSRTEFYKSEAELVRAKLEILQRSIEDKEIEFQKELDSREVVFMEEKYLIQQQLLEQKSKFMDLEHTESEMRVSLSDWQEKFSQSKVTNSETVAKLNDLLYEKEASIESLEGKIGFLENGLRTATQSHQEAKLALIKKESSLQQSVYELEQKFHKIHSLHQKQYRSLLQERKQLQKCIRNSDHFSNEQSKQLQTLGTQMTQLQEFIQAQKKESGDRFSAYENQISNLKSNHAIESEEYEQRIRQLEQAIPQKDTSLQNLKKQKQVQIEKLRLQIDSLKEEILGYEAEKIQSELALNQMNEKLLKESKQNQHLKTDILLKGQTIDELNAKIQSELTLKIDQLQQESASVQECRKEITQLAQKCEKLSSDLRTSQDMLLLREEALEAEKAQIQLSFDEKSQQMQKEITELNEKISSDESLFNSKLSDAEVKLSEQIAKNNKIQKQYEELKTDKETFAVLNFKQSTDLLKSKIKELQRSNKILEKEISKIESLERNLKIKTIQISSLKYKNSQDSRNETVKSEKQIQLEQILTLKEEQINCLKSEVEKWQYMEEQLWQTQAHNEALHTQIEQLEEARFNFESEQNEKNILITDLQTENGSLSCSLKEAAAKNSQMLKKIKYYESLILEFKGYENSLSSTSSPSEMLIQSREKPNRESDSIKLFENDCEASPVTVGLKEEIVALKNIKAQISDEIDELKRQKMQQQKQYIKGPESKLLSSLSMSSSFDVKKSEAKPSREFTTSDFSQICKELSQVIKFRKQTLHEEGEVLSKKARQKNMKEEEMMDISSINSNSRSTFNPFNDPVNLNNMTQQQTNDEIYSFKCRLLIKEFQSVKSKIMRSEGRNYQQKAKLIAIIKPCEQIMKEMLRVSSSEDSRVLKD